MFRGFSRPSYSRLYTWYWVVIWSAVLYCVALSLFAGNNVAIRLEVPGADRWKSWTFWRFFITGIVMVWPLFTLMLLMMFNTRRFLFTLHLWVGIAVAAWMGVLIVFFIIDWANCANVAYCVSDNNSDHVDISFFFAFCAACTMFALNVAWLIWNRYLRNRTDIGLIIAATSDPMRGDFNGGGFAGIFQRIGAPMGGACEEKGKIRLPLSADLLFYLMEGANAADYHTVPLSDAPRNVQDSRQSYSFSNFKT